jgi:hypothetical protein
LSFSKGKSENEKWEYIQSRRWRDPRAGSHAQRTYENVRRIEGGSRRGANPAPEIIPGHDTPFELDVSRRRVTNWSARSAVDVVAGRAVTP